MNAGGRHGDTEYSGGAPAHRGCGGGRGPRAVQGIEYERVDVSIGTGSDASAETVLAAYAGKD